MSTDEQEQIIKDLLYDIDRMKRDRACHRAKLNQLLSQFDALRDAAEHGLIDHLDEDGTLWVRIALGANEIRQLYYPSLPDLVAAAQAITDLTARLAKKEEDLEHCRGRS